MNKALRRFSFLLAILMVFSTGTAALAAGADVVGASDSTAAAAAVWDGVTYTEPERDEDGYYLIGTAQELMWWNRQWAEISNSAAGAISWDNIRLTDDIYLNETGAYDNTWPLLWGNVDTASYYAGQFEGNGHTIYGLNLYQVNDGGDNRRGVGFIGYTQGTFTDLGISGRIIVEDQPAASRVATWNAIGGLAGLAEGADISGCYTDVSIEYYAVENADECYTYIGGIAGAIVSSAITNSYSTGFIYGQGVEQVSSGGIVGQIRYSSPASTIQNTYSTSEVGAWPLTGSTVSSYVGGIVGNGNNAGATVENNVAVNTCLGGSTAVAEINRIAGNAVSGVTLSNNYAANYIEFIGTAGTSEGADTLNGQSVTDTAICDKTVFLDQAGWAADTWNFDVDGLPLLAWQEIEAAPAIVSVTPSGDNVALDGDVVIEFNTAMSPDSGAVALNGETLGGGAWSDGGHVYTIPYAGLREETTYTIAVTGFVTAEGEAAVSGGPYLFTTTGQVWDGVTYTEPERDGDGYYLIGTAEELMWWNAQWAGVSGSSTDKLRLTADIYLNSQSAYVNEWPAIFPISTRTFNGEFNGDGHTIHGLYINQDNTGSSYADGVGLVGYSRNAVFTDLGITGEINVHNEPDSSFTWMMIGPVAGYNYGSSFTGCYTDVDIHYTTVDSPRSCDTFIGGIIGASEGGTYVGNCYSLGAITGAGTSQVSIGGIAGQLRYTSSSAAANTRIENSYSASVIHSEPLAASTSSSYLGGIVGNGNNANHTVRNNVALNPSISGTAQVTAINRVIGNAVSGVTLTGNYAADFVTLGGGAGIGTETGAATPMGETVSRAQINDKSVFTDLAGFSADYWNFDVDSYPLLWWQPVYEAFIPVEDVVIDGLVLQSVAVGKQLQLTATITPADATDQSLTWTSTNTNYATVEDGVVTGVAPGTVIITATANNGISYSMRVKVTAF